MRTNNLYSQRLEKRIEQLEAALRPFAEAFPEWEGIGADHLTLRQMYDEIPGDAEIKSITFADLKRAHEVLGP
jgi:hypothetical protein